jgi:hypothetical protein
MMTPLATPTANLILTIQNYVCTHLLSCNQLLNHVKIDLNLEEEPFNSAITTAK